MLSLGRTDTSVVGRWWWTVDRWTIVALLVLVGIGVLLSLAASPAVADRIGADSFHFIRRHFVFLIPTLVVIIGVSMLTPRQVLRLAAVMFLLALLLLVAVLFLGEEIKGSTRWLSFAGLTIQPSELMKPAFAVICAKMLAEGLKHPQFWGRSVSALLFVVVAGLLMAQPDVGQTLIISAVFGIQLFLAGLPIILVAGLAGVMVLGGFGAYFSFSHVQQRVDNFLNPSGGDAYQIATALTAFRNGGIFGRGPGEGRVKLVLPDAHTDFILAVAGEEFGIILCLVVVALFALILIRSFTRLSREPNTFIVIAASGLMTQLAMQAIINMASSLRLMPTKGMTLPFISYGGSSMLAMAMGMGMLLALTRSRYGDEDSL